VARHFALTGAGDWLSQGLQETFFLIKNQFFLAFTGGAAVEQPIESQNKFFRA